VPRRFREAAQLESTPFSVQAELPDPDTSIVRMGLESPRNWAVRSTVICWKDGPRGEFFPLAVRRLAGENRRSALNLKPTARRPNELSEN
jgi:hypothetical protein